MSTRDILPLQLEHESPECTCVMFAPHAALGCGMYHCLHRVGGLPIIGLSWMHMAAGGKIGPLAQTSQAPRANQGACAALEPGTGAALQRHAKKLKTTTSLEVAARGCANFCDAKPDAEPMPPAPGSRETLRDAGRTVAAEGCDCQVQGRDGIVCDGAGPRKGNTLVEALRR
ncbi:hypothetical protein EDC01DRAFT_633337 [Geopyxis carbonaria]|nr:hypothetical protein EDC01DRAFT_633337 [Geopyxis carbonaria]